jgi:hypothetical protein
MYWPRLPIIQGPKAKHDVNHHLHRFQNRVEKPKKNVIMDIRGEVRDIIGREWDVEEGIEIGGLKVQLGGDGKTCDTGR